MLAAYNGNSISSTRKGKTFDTLIPQLNSLTMNTYYTINIPEPCHEDWNAMTPSAKGRFCSSCEKTVIDFTKMSHEEIGSYLKNHLSSNVCGHFYKSQLDHVVIKIPVEIFQELRYGYRFFALALLLVMGTTLFSCVSDNGSKQKIDRVEVIDSATSSDSKKNCSDLLQGINDTLLEDIPITGRTAPPPLPPTIEGEIAFVQGDVDVEEVLSAPYSYSFVDHRPLFKNSSSFKSISEEKSYFNDRLNDFVKEHFNDTIVLKSKASDKIRISIKFQINESGRVEEVDVFSKNEILAQEAKRVINLLPPFIPAQHDGKEVPVVFVLPITYLKTTS